MQRRPLLDLLDNYTPFNSTAAEALDKILSFVRYNEDCFLRSNLSGHLTASAWIVDPLFTSTLLIHHRQLDKWIQCGGHADGNPDLPSLALQEAREETGLQSIKLFNADIFDLDVHRIPEYKDIPTHYHYDVRFLFTADPKEQPELNNREIAGLLWIPLSDVSNYNSRQSIMRMVNKTVLLRDKQC